MTELYDTFTGIVDDAVIVHNENNIMSDQYYNVDFWDMPIINITQNFKSTI